MPRVIAVDLGSHQVKLTSWRLSGRSEIELEDRLAVSVPQGGALPTLDARLAALDALLDEHPTLAAQPSDRCVFSLPGELASYHRLVLPFNDRAQVEKTLRFALEAEVPYDLDDMVVGWRVLKADLTSEVLTVSSPHDRLTTWIKALAERSLDPERVYVDTELLGALGGGPGMGEGATAVVDVGHTHTAVAILVDGKVSWCRTVSVAGYAFTRAIQTALDCDWAEAEARKHGTWTADAANREDDVERVDDEPTDSGRAAAGSPYASLPERARKGLDGAIGLLLAELRSTLIRAEDDLGVEIGELRLAGGGAQIPELWDYLAADLGIPVRPAKPANGEIVPAGWSVSHSAAQALLGPANQVTDLRIGDLAYKGGTDMLRATLVYGGAGAMFFAFAAVVVFVFQFTNLMQQQSAAEEELRTLVKGTFPETPDSLLEDTSSATQLMREFTTDAVQRAALLGDGAGGVPPTVDALARLTEAFPEHPTVTVTVDQLTMTPASIQFTAETDGYAASAEVEKALQQSEDFSTATKGDETKKGNRVDFPITIPLDGTKKSNGEEG